jgi:hypothetical protein
MDTDDACKGQFNRKNHHKRKGKHSERKKRNLRNCALCRLHGHPQKIFSESLTTHGIASGFRVRRIGGVQFRL